MVATSSAAEEARPADIGMVEWMARSSPWIEGFFKSINSWWWRMKRQPAM